jgi:HK97 family phage prohead protease
MKKQLFTTNSFKVKSVSDDEDNREIDFIASKEVRDRQGEIITIKGIDLKNFKASPVILWSHNHNDPPIGKATKIYKSDDELHIRIEYAPSDVYSFADTIFKLTKGGYINALSIGFLPDYSEVTYDEKKNSRIYNKTELLEVSVVNVGANQAALRKAMDDGIIDELERKEFDIYCKKSNEYNSENEVNSEEIKNIKIEIDEIKTCINKVSEEIRKDSAAAQANANSQTDDYTEAEMEEIMDYLEFNDKENK